MTNPWMAAREFPNLIDVEYKPGRESIVCGHVYNCYLMGDGSLVFCEQGQKFARTEEEFRLFVATQEFLIRRYGTANVSSLRDFWENES